MTPIHCSSRGTECDCLPSECRSCPAQTIQSRKSVWLDEDVTKALRITAYAGLVLAFIGLVAAFQIGADESHQQQLIAQEASVSWTK